MGMAIDSYEIRSGAIRWLTFPGRDVPDGVKPALLAELLSSRVAIVMGAITGLMVSGLSIVHDGSTVFFVLAAIEVAVFFARIAVLRDLRRADEGETVVIDRAIALSCIWCALQGCVAFFAMKSGDTVLMVVSATLIMALIGPLCARNYAAPRLAFLLVALCDLPFVAGALASGNPWYLILLLMTPLFMIGSMQIVTNYKSAMVRALAAEMANLELSRRDPLTGLLNRGGLNAEMADVDTEGYLAIIAMDLDGFKQINDSHGHAAGDTVLEEVSTRMRNLARPGDLLARLGGDEFMVVLRGVAPEYVKVIADQYLRGIRDNGYRLDSDEIVRVGVSIGYACLPDDTRDVDKLREYADRALYAVKEDGKGTCAPYSERMAA